MSNEEKTVYRVIQYGGRKGNIAVTDFESLLTHHPLANEHASLVNGVAAGMEDQQPDYDGGDRDYAFIGGEFQEIQTPVGSRTFGLKNDQVLLKKDFILEHPDHPSRSNAARKVDVPSPIAGYIGRIDTSQGLLDIYDKKGGDVIARVRHMRDISEAVAVGQTVEYGQTLGTQSDVKTENKHVHLEMDTRYYQQFENYINDLVSGRLPVQAEHRKDVQPQPVVDDGVMRLGEYGERVAAVQRALVADGYRGVGNKPIEVDGAYRMDMQGAILAFQQDHKLPQTGDIDPATYQLALRVNLDKPLAPAKRSFELDFLSVADDALFRKQHDIHRGLDPAYTLRPEQMQQWYPPDPARTGRTPQHHDHPDHKLHQPSLEREPIHTSAHAEPAASASLPEPDLFDRVIDALINQDDDALHALSAEYFQSPDGQQLLQEGRVLGHAMERKADALALAQGRPLPTGYSIGTLTGKQDPRDWDHPDHALYSAIRRELPREVSDEMAAHVMLQARQAGIHNADRLEHVSVQNNQVFVGGRNFSGMTHVDLSQTPPPMEDTLQQSQRLDQQLALERQQWLAQQQEQARNGPSMSL